MQACLEREILAGVAPRPDPGGFARGAEAQPDVLHAVLCLLAGVDFLSREAVAPEPERVALARREGWIWVR